MGSAVNQLRIRPIAALVGLVFAIAACTSAGGASTPPSNAPTAAPSTAVSPAPSASGGGSYEGGSAQDDYGTPSKAPGASGGAASVTVEIATKDPVGKFLTGLNGATLYTFKPDTTNTSTCVDKCADSWPPLTVAAGGSAVAGTGVTGAFTTFARPDGTMQVAYGGRPLYYFSGDASPGDTNGQGRGDAWFVAAP
jgi:predicted lipoprotein with Yx(FWY)xxD motif